MFFVLSLRLGVLFNRRFHLPLQFISTIFDREMSSAFKFGRNKDGSSCFNCLKKQDFCAKHASLKPAAPASVPYFAIAEVIFKVAEFFPTPKQLVSYTGHETVAAGSRKRKRATNFVISTHLDLRTVCKEWDNAICSQVCCMHLAQQFSQSSSNALIFAAFSVTTALTWTVRSMLCACFIHQ